MTLNRDMDAITGVCKYEGRVKELTYQVKIFFLVIIIIVYL